MGRIRVHIVFFIAKASFTAVMCVREHPRLADGGMIHISVSRQYLLYTCFPLIDGKHGGCYDSQDNQQRPSIIIWQILPK